MRFSSYINGDERFMAPETSMEVQAALGSDLALVFDECTPFHATRDYTARSTERTHRWLAAAWTGTPSTGRPGQLVFGIVQGGVHDDLRRESTEIVGTSEVDGVAIGGSLGETRRRCTRSPGWSTEVCRVAPDKPRHLLGIGEVDDLIRGVELGIDHFDCAMPTRIARHGMALVPDPERRWRVDLTRRRFKDSDEPILDGCPCPCCAAGFSRGYLRYLLKARELTGMRLVTLHNLAFVSRLMTDLREAILQGTLSEVAAALRTGAAPGLSRSAA